MSLVAAAQWPLASWEAISKSLLDTPTVECLRELARKSTDLPFPSPLTSSSATLFRVEKEEVRPFWSHIAALVWCGIDAPFFSALPTLVLGDSM